MCQFVSASVSQFSPCLTDLDHIVCQPLSLSYGLGHNFECLIWSSRANFSQLCPRDKVHTVLSTPNFYLSMSIDTD